MYVWRFGQEVEEPSFRDLKGAFRDYRDTRGKTVTPAVLALLNCVNIIPVSTAECERGFSKMNVICSSLWTRLTVPHNSSLMFVSFCGPPVHLWQPVKYVKCWLALNMRSVDLIRAHSARLHQTHQVQQQSSMWRAMWAVADPGVGGEGVPGLSRYFVLYVCTNTLVGHKSVTQSDKNEVRLITTEPILHTVADIKMKNRSWMRR